MLRNACRPGDYVLENGLLLEAWPAQRCGAATAREASAAFLLGNDRTSEQNVEHSFNQMVEIAIRAVSPAISDPFTTLTCIDWLGSALVRVAREGLPGPVRDAVDALSRGAPSHGGEQPPVDSRGEAAGQRP